MNRPSRTDEPYEGEGHNQSPSSLPNELTTNEDLNGLANAREVTQNAELFRFKNGPPWSALQWSKDSLMKFGTFIGPGFMIAVAYIDPGNYATDVAAGATYEYRLLFIVLLANIFAIFLQTLCIKLGTVTGLNLAECCRAFLPRWLNLVLYIFAEVAIIATDIAEVIGFAIALNLLIPAVPLVVGCAISILDVFVTLYFYNPQGSMKELRIFECFIACLVLSVVVCFCIQLSMIQETPVGDVFKGYLPSEAIIEGKGLYQACGILGATVMPHSLYLGSGIVQPRLREFDAKNGLLSTGASTAQQDGEDVDKSQYVPSLKAIRHAMAMSSFELGIALFTFALFVNSAILIVAGDSLYGTPNASAADIFSIHELLSESISTAAGTMFALALLLSGVSAGIVCTIAGQMVCEGALNWKMRPWLRRLVTRSISITPSVIIAGAVGRQGISAALNASQVALSVVLPFLTAPLIYFTCCGKFMTVQVESVRDEGEHTGGVRDVAAGECSITTVQFANSWYTTVIAVLVWIAIAGMNVANLVLLGQGN
ncbi:Manganese transporter SMF1 like protein [Verticillium longisporum]|nr:Manganese transporter SMF1 like protein [Verticillium longisporum]